MKKKPTTRQRIALWVCNGLNALFCSLNMHSWRVDNAAQHIRSCPHCAARQRRAKWDWNLWIDEPKPTKA